MWQEVEKKLFTSRVSQKTEIPKVIFIRWKHELAKNELLCKQCQ